MTKQEAIDWLEGKRSICDYIQREPWDTYEIRVAQADLAYIQQAYWVLKAHSEDLIKQQVGFIPIKIEQGKMELKPRPFLNEKDKRWVENE